MAERKINIQTLVDFAEKRKKVDPWQLTEAAESLYKSIKIVGIANTTVTYDGTITCKANETSHIVRAFAAHIMRLIHRWSDANGRLEQHYSLDISISVILADTGVLKTNGADIACTNVAEMIDTWATK